MPIIPKFQTRRLSQEEFGKIAYEVMNQVFSIHNEMGRFFDEKNYQHELAARFPHVTLEGQVNGQVNVVYENFTKRYYADVIVGEGSLFEFKAAGSIHKQHESQAIHYLHLLDLAHGKIINIRPEQVESKFVNCSQRLDDLKNPEIVTESFIAKDVGSKAFRDVLVKLIQDWGTGLELKLYEGALVHFLGGDREVCQKSRVIGSRGDVGFHSMNYISHDEVFWLTSFPRPSRTFETHARRLLKHTDFKVIQWANINSKTVVYTTIS